MPRIDRRRLRTGLRLGLARDPVASRNFTTAMRVQLGGAVAVLLVLPLAPDVLHGDRNVLVGLVVSLVVLLLVVQLTVGRSDPRRGWVINTVAEAVTIFLAMWFVPDAFVAGLIAFSIIVAATTAIGGLGVGLLISAVGVTAVGICSTVAPGDPESVALAFGLSMVAYPAIALSVDGFTLNRHRAATQLARLHEALHAVSAEPSLAGTLDSLVAAVRETFEADSVVVLLREGDHLKLAAPSNLPPRYWDDSRIARSTAKELSSTDFSPISAAITRGETVVVADVASEARFPEWAEHWTTHLGQYGLSSVVAVPLRQGAESVGVLQVCFTMAGAIDDDELALLEAYADQATVVILRAQAFAELQAADAMKSEFLATVSHELRTPLTAAKGFVDTVLLHWDVLDDTQRRQLLERASENSEELARLIDQLLDYSRLDAGPVRIVPTTVELEPLIAVTVARLAPALGDHVVVVDTDPDVWVSVDVDAFGHVLANLLTNAARFSSKGSTIHVASGESDGMGEVVVHDDGVGIAPEDQERIFERFYRVGAVSGSGRGTGLGLAIAARFVGLLGGTIRVDSEPGRGSTFSFTVPLDAERAALQSELAAQEYS